MYYLVSKPCQSNHRYIIIQWIFVWFRFLAAFHTLVLFKGPLNNKGLIGGLSRTMKNTIYLFIILNTIVHIWIAQSKRKTYSYHSEYEMSKMNQKKSTAWMEGKKDPIDERLQIFNVMAQWVFLCISSKLE